MLKKLIEMLAIAAATIIVVELFFPQLKGCLLIAPWHF